MNNRGIENPIQERWDGHRIIHPVTGDVIVDTRWSPRLFNKLTQVGARLLNTTRSIPVRVVSGMATFLSLMTPAMAKEESKFPTASYYFVDSYSVEDESVLMYPCRIDLAQEPQNGDYSSAYLDVIKVLSNTCNVAQVNATGDPSYYDLGEENFVYIVKNITHIAAKVWWGTNPDSHKMRECIQALLKAAEPIYNSAAYKATTKTYPSTPEPTSPPTLTPSEDHAGRDIGLVMLGVSLGFISAAGMMLICKRYCSSVRTIVNDEDSASQSMSDEDSELREVVVDVMNVKKILAPTHMQRLEKIGVEDPTQEPDYLNIFTCPIDKFDVMDDPVLASDGHTYERKAIEDWYKISKTSPITREAITGTFTINRGVKSLIDNFVEGCERTVARRANTKKIENSRNRPQRRHSIGSSIEIFNKPQHTKVENVAESRQTRERRLSM